MGVGEERKGKRREWEGEKEGEREGGRKVNIVKFLLH